MNLLVSGGRILDPGRQLDSVGDVLVSDGRIARIWLDGAVGGAAPQSVRQVDARGCLVVPGLVDLHCHLREPGFEDKETIETGARAAARGGFTTVCCMPNTRPPIDNRGTLEYVQQAAEQSRLARVLPIAAITKSQAGQELTEMWELAGAGAVAFSDDGKTVANSRLLRHALTYSEMCGRPVVEHCEDLELADNGVMNEGPVATRLGLRGVPNAAEEAIVARDIALAELTGGRLHIAHVSTARTVDLIRDAKSRGIRVTAEVTPHHLFMTDEWVAGERGQWPRRLPYDTNTKVNPPLRAESDRRALLQGLTDGTIDAIATDHAPHTVVDKLCEYDLAAWGISGLETALPLLLTLVSRGELELTTLIAKLTSGPSGCFDLASGSLSEGAPADIAVVDLQKEWLVDVRKFASKGWNSPLDGVRLTGSVRYTIVGGDLVHGADAL